MYNAYVGCRRELRSFNISVHIIEPGFFRTAITDPVKLTTDLKNVWSELSDEVKKPYGENYISEGQCNEFIHLWHNAYCNIKRRMAHCLHNRLTRLVDPGSDKSDTAWSGPCPPTEILVLVDQPPCHHCAACAWSNHKTFLGVHSPVV